MKSEFDDEMDAELRTALRRQPPAEGFAARVAARVRPPRPAPWRRWAALAAMATVVGVTAATLRWQSERRVRAEAAGRQLVLALQVAGGDYQRIAAQVRRVSGGGE